MGVYAHPDDEQGISGSFAKYAKQGANTTLICATRGEVGEIAPGVDATPENLGQVREGEMRCPKGKCADLEEGSSREAVTELVRSTVDGQHGGCLLWARRQGGQHGRPAGG